MCISDIIREKIDQSCSLDEDCQCGCEGGDPDEDTFDAEPMKAYSPDQDLPFKR
jgi:hypothetical protein